MKPSSRHCSRRITYREAERLCQHSHAARGYSCADKTKRLYWNVTKSVRVSVTDLSFSARMAAVEAVYSELMAPGSSVPGSLAMGT